MEGRTRGHAKLRQPAKFGVCREDGLMALTVRILPGIRLRGRRGAGLWGKHEQEDKVGVKDKASRIGGEALKLCSGVHGRVLPSVLSSFRQSAASRCWACVRGRFQMIDLPKTAPSDWSVAFPGDTMYIGRSPVLPVRCHQPIGADCESQDGYVR